MMRKFLPAAVAAVLVFAATPAGADEPDEIGVDDYVAELTAAAASDPQAAETLDDFEELTSAEQVEFVDYLDDPAVVDQLFAMPAEDGTTVTHDGDVVTTATTTLTRTPVRTPVRSLSATTAAARTTTYNVTAKRTFTSSMFGVVVTKVTQTFKYVTGNNRVLRTTSCIATAVNYNFVISMDDSTSYYMVGSEAQCDTVWHGYVVYKNFGVRLDKIQSMRVNGQGVKWATMKNA